MKKKYYAGIGSRQTPEPVCNYMVLIAHKLSLAGYILRSGGADGADKAFEIGADKDKKEIFLPWKGFNNNPSPLYHLTDEATELARKYHPKWKNLTPSARSFHTRNCYQILGYDLKTPVDFVICWTADGKASGGTGQAIRIATAYSIPVYNLFNPAEKLLLKEFLKGLHNN